MLVSSKCGVCRSCSEHLNACLASENNETVDITPNLNVPRHIFSRAHNTEVLERGHTLTVGVLSTGMLNPLCSCKMITLGKAEAPNEKIKIQLLSLVN